MQRRPNAVGRSPRTAGRVTPSSTASWSERRELIGHRPAVGVAPRRLFPPPASSSARASGTRRRQEQDVPGLLKHEIRHMDERSHRGGDDRPGDAPPDPDENADGTGLAERATPCVRAPTSPAALSVAKTTPHRAHSVPSGSRCVAPDAGHAIAATVARRLHAIRPGGRPVRPAQIPLGRSRRACTKGWPVAWGPGAVRPIRDIEGDSAPFTGRRAGPIVNWTPSIRPCRVRSFGRFRRL